MAKVRALASDCWAQFNAAIQHATGAHNLLSNNKSTNDYNYSTLQQAVLCTMVATTYLATYLVWGYYEQCTNDLSTQLNWGKTKWGILACLV